MADLPYMKFYPADWLADCGAVAIIMGLMTFVGKVVAPVGNAPAEQS